MPNRLQLTTADVIGGTKLFQMRVVVKQIVLDLEKTMQVLVRLQMLEEQCILI